MVYGDTDSLFIELPGRSLEEAHRIGKEMAATISKSCPPDVVLKFEKVTCAFVPNGSTEGVADSVSIFFNYAPSPPPLSTLLPFYIKSRYWSRYFGVPCIRSRLPFFHTCICLPYSVNNSYVLCFVDARRISWGQVPEDGLA